MTADDMAKDLLARSWPPPSDATRAGIPVGFTYAMLIPRDTGDLDQAAYERANGKAMAAILEDAGAPALVFDGHIVVRVLDAEGKVLPAARAAAEAMASLEEYPLLDEQLYSAIQQESAELEWDEIESEIEDGTFHDDDKTFELEKKKLPRGWQAKLRRAYYKVETETQEDDRGYAIVDRDVLRPIVEKMFGFLQEEPED